jgi:hypothetical protein
MGWWKCNEHGGIDWSTTPTGHSATSLINAIPGRDSIEDYYNGDAPADAMFVPTAILKYWFEGRTPKPTKDQLVKLFVDKEVDPIFEHIDRNKLFELIDITWKEIDAIYNETWGRPAYPEERYYICSFALGGADGWADRRNQTPSARKKDRKEWWGMRDTDRTYIDNYKQGKWPYWWHNS